MNFSLLLIISTVVIVLLCIHSSFATAEEQQKQQQQNENQKQQFKHRKLAPCVWTTEISEQEAANENQGGESSDLISDALRSLRAKATADATASGKTSVEPSTVVLGVVFASAPPSSSASSSSSSSSSPSDSKKRKNKRLSILQRRGLLPPIFVDQLARRQSIVEQTCRDGVIQLTLVVVQQQNEDGAKNTKKGKKNNKKFITMSHIEKLRRRHGPILYGVLANRDDSFISSEETSLPLHPFQDASARALLQLSRKEKQQQALTSLSIIVHQFFLSLRNWKIVIDAEQKCLFVGNEKNKKESTMSARQECIAKYFNNEMPVVSVLEKLYRNSNSYGGSLSSLSSNSFVGSDSFFVRVSHVGDLAMLQQEMGAADPGRVVFVVNDFAVFPSLSSSSSSSSTSSSSSSAILAAASEGRALFVWYRYDSSSVSRDEQFLFGKENEDGSLNQQQQDAQAAWPPARIMPEARLTSIKRINSSLWQTYDRHQYRFGTASSFIAVLSETLVDDGIVTPFNFKGTKQRAKIVEESHARAQNRLDNEDNGNINQQKKNQQEEQQRENIQRDLARLDEDWSVLSPAGQMPVSEDEPVLSSDVPTSIHDYHLQDDSNKGNEEESDDEDQDGDSGHNNGDDDEQEAGREDEQEENAQQDKIKKQQLEEQLKANQENGNNGAKRQQTHFFFFNVHQRVPNTIVHFIRCFANPGQLEPMFDRDRRLLMRYHRFVAVAIVETLGHDQKYNNDFAGQLFALLTNADEQRGARAGGLIPFVRENENYRDARQASEKSHTEQLQQQRQVLVPVMILNAVLHGEFTVELSLSSALPAFAIYDRRERRVTTNRKFFAENRFRDAVAFGRASADLVARIMSPYAEERRGITETPTTLAGRIMDTIEGTVPFVLSTRRWLRIDPEMMLGCIGAAIMAVVIVVASFGAFHLMNLPVERMAHLVYGNAEEQEAAKRKVNAAAELVKEMKKK